MGKDVSDGRLSKSCNDEINLRVLFVLGLLMYLVTAAFNIGFIAVDDYESGIAPVIPAQRQVVADIIKGSDFRSPIPSLTLLGISRLAYRLGIENPTIQFRVVLVVLALIAFLFHATFAMGHFRVAHPGQRIYEGLALFFIGFYFLCPLFLTRPLIEAMSAPFLTASSYYACAYFAAPRRGPLLAAVFFLALASVFRFQAGICALALGLTILAARRPRDLIPFSLFGALLFVGTGLMDLAMKGGFHISLLSYIRYNLAYSSSFGTPPAYTFLLLFLGLSVPPAFFSRYRHFAWVREYRPLLPAVFFFAVFVGGHSLIPHKEERFMVPILPIFLILLVPLAKYLITGGGGRWRVAYFLSLNFILLILTSFNIPQNNVVELGRYVEGHAWIKKVIGVEDTLVLFPGAFILRPVQEQKVGLGELNRVDASFCDSVVAIRLDWEQRIGHPPDGLVKIANFQPGFLEALVVKLNPKQNGRRGSIALFAPAECAGLAK